MSALRLGHGWLSLIECCISGLLTFVHFSKVYKSTRLRVPHIRLLYTFGGEGWGGGGSVGSLLPPCFLQRCSHFYIKETTNIQSKNIEALNNNFLFWLKVRLFGG